jgi:hypothetical protein
VGPVPRLAFRKDGSPQLHFQPECNSEVTVVISDYTQNRRLAGVNEFYKKQLMTDRALGADELLFIELIENCPSGQAHGEQEIP